MHETRDITLLLVFRLLFTLLVIMVLKDIDNLIDNNLQFLNLTFT